MVRREYSSCTLIVALLASGCNNSAADSTPAAAKSAALDDGIGMLEHAATIADSNAGNCDAIGSEMASYYSANAAKIHNVMHEYETMPAAERSELQKQYRARFHAAWARLHPMLTRCKTNAQIRRVNEALVSPTLATPP
jgi:hypothetical protein